MGRSKKAIRLTVGAVSAICLLTLMAGCGQASGTNKKSTSSDQPQKTSQTDNTQTSAEKTSSSSGADNASSETSANKTQQETSSAGSSKASQTESVATPNVSASNEAITVMAYVKSMGGLENVPENRLIVDVNLLALEVPASASGNRGDLKLINISGDQVKVTDVVLNPQSNGKTAVYNVSDLLNEYYQTQQQQSEINNLLSQGSRHNVIDFLAWMQKYEVCPDYDRNCYTGQNVEIMGNTISDGTDGTTGTITLNGNEVTMVNYRQDCGGSSGCKAPIKTVWTFNADELLDKYYSTEAQKQTINNYINQAHQSQSSWLG